LVTITIVSIISAAILGTAVAAMESGRRSRTRSIVAKLHGLVMERWDSYATRRIDIRPDIERALNDPQSSVPLAERGQMMADARLLALRELMKMEMPDRWSDVVNQPTTQGNLSLLNPPTVLSSVPGVTQMYRRRLGEMIANNVDIDAINDNQAAECLYLTVMYATGDGEARTLFTSNDIGDVDGDGAPEFLDGWGQPIQWIRWPAGFGPYSALMVGDADVDHDPFDVFRRDLPTVATPAPGKYPAQLNALITEMRQRNTQTSPVTGNLCGAFRLVPLIFSGGSDGLTALRTIDESDPSFTGLIIDPYYLLSDGYQNASPDLESDAWKDNIHNQLIEY
jgi:hypothetical protein